MSDEDTGQERRVRNRDYELENDCLQMMNDGLSMMNDSLPMNVEENQF